MVHADREAYYGDLHLHTSYSVDAYLFGSRIDPEGAYRFARGETVSYRDQEIKRTTAPLDFLAVTDHAEWLGVMNTLKDPESAFSHSELGQSIRAGEWAKTWSLMGEWPDRSKEQPGVDTHAILRSNWQRTIEAAKSAD